MAAANPETNGTKLPVSSTVPTVLSWVNEEHFLDVIQKQVPGFKKIVKFHAGLYGDAGGNNASIMVRVKATVELEGGSTQDLAYMIKTIQQDGTGANLAKMLDFFPKEIAMYRKCIPAFEQMFCDVGKQVSFGPRSYTLGKTHEANYVLLEDLSLLGFKNVDRHEGLDREHTESVLRLLAQMHAASAAKFATKNDYDSAFMKGNLTEANKSAFSGMLTKRQDIFMKCLLMSEFGHKYEEQVKQYLAGVIENLIKLGTPDLSDFNVINHGDLWSNNIMFRYNDEGKLDQTIFVDFQMSRFGSPAIDLYYFLLSSTTLDLKVSHFDLFVKYYHDHLVESLKLLNYTKAIPSLKQLHIDLLKYNYYGMSTVTGVLAAALMDPTNNAIVENFLGEGDAAMQFKIRMYRNPRFVRHMEVILEWLDMRGLLP